MRPKLLKMTAFGPYAGEQVIDFTKLEDANMFLIYGPTGGGKTTILDAICYALYGQTNGGERSGENMRSKFAEEGAVTEVELFFNLRDQEYRIMRRPQYEREAKKGAKGKLVKVMSEVELYKKQEGEFKILSAKLNEVDKMVSELLHFNIDQFRQVIMIAQNKFRELLTVSSKERQQILQDIFETGIYQNVEKNLELLNANSKEGVREKELIYENIMNNLNPEENPNLVDYIQTKVMYNAPEVCEILQANCQEKTKEEAALQKQLKETETELQKAQKTLMQVTSQYEAVQEQEQVSQKLEALKAKENEFKALAEQIKLAEKTEAIFPIEAIIEELKTSVQQGQKEVETEKALLQEVSEGLVKAQESLKAGAHLPQEVEALKKEFSVLETYLPKVAHLSEKLKEKQDIDTHLQKAKVKFETLTQKINDLKLEMKQGQERLKGKDALQKERGDLQLKLQQIEAVLQKRAERALKAEEGEKRFTELEALQNLIEEKTKGYNLEEAHYRRAFSAWFNNQAGEIAKQLVENEPCPVCGSLSHPQKAVVTEAHITKEALDELEAGLKSLERELSHLRERRSGLEKECKLLKNFIETIDEALKGQEAFNEAAQVAGKGRLIELQKQLSDLQEVAQLLEQDEKNLSQMEEQKQVGAEYISKEQLALRENETYITSIQSEVPAELQNQEALEEKLQTLKQSFTQKEKAYETLQAAVEQLTTQQAQRQIVVTEGEKRVAGLMEQGAQKKVVLMEALAKAGFVSYAQYKESKMEAEVLQSAKRSVEDFNHEKIVLGEKYKNLVAQTKDFKVERLHAIQNEYNDIVTASRTLGVQLSETTRYLSSHEKMIEQLKALYEEATDLIKKQRIIEKISTLAKGKNKKGLSFERYIQSSIFEEVLVSANKKLKPMTQNRYELYRSDDLTRSNAQAGLDIGIMDYYSNEKRPVNTLSGGESFMAALALALGLSEVIQRLAGATPLDTLFIDEGFGSLDEEALEMAIKTLLSIQDTGRLIGIISHVRELREQIPVGLEITTGPNGSKAAFKL